MKELWVVEFESAHYAGASEHCLAWAENEDNAKDAAADWAEEFYYEQDQKQFLEENDSDDGESYANVVSAQLLVGSDFEKYVNDPSQASFYPIVNDA